MHPMRTPYRDSRFFGPGLFFGAPFLGGLLGGFLGGALVRPRPFYGYGPGFGPGFGYGPGFGPGFGYGPGFGGYPYW